MQRQNGASPGLTVTSLRLRMGLIRLDLPLQAQTTFRWVDGWHRQPFPLSGPRWHCRAILMPAPHRLRPDGALLPF